MSLGQFPRLQRYKPTLKLLSSINEVVYKVKNFETPEKIKGTFLERWGRYWKNLYIDYRDVAIDVVKDCKAHPILASTYGSFVALLVYLNKHNPDETSFREHLLQNSIRVMQVGEPLRNPISEQHIKWLQNCYDEGIIRRMDLGIISLIWLDNYDTACSLYKAVCPHLKPRYVTFYERIVDVGFIDKWWILENKMKDYDVNEAEFANV